MRELAIRVMRAVDDWEALPLTFTADSPWEVLYKHPGAWW